jgi:phage portal protein BeeE
MRNIFDIFSRSPEVKSSRTARLLALESGGRARWTPRDYAALAREGYVQNAIVHRAVKLVAENAAAVPFLLYEGAAAHDKHPLLDLLARPNPRQDGATFLESIYGYLLLAGNAYVEAVALDGALRELYALRPDRMRVVPGMDGWPEAYEYTVAGNCIRFDQSAQPLPPILHLTAFHPLDDHYGLAPLEAAAVAVDTHNAAARWNKALLDNAARPSGALVYSGPEGSVLSDNQFERLKRELEDTYQGTVNAGRPLLLEGGLDWKAMSLSPKERWALPHRRRLPWVPPSPARRRTRQRPPKPPTPRAPPRRIGLRRWPKLAKRKSRRSIRPCAQRPRAATRCKDGGGRFTRWN